MKAEVISASREGNPVPVLPAGGGAGVTRRLYVTCGPTEDDNSLRNLAFTVPWTDENRAKYAVGNIVELAL